MARSQLEDDTETFEQALARANAQAKAEREAAAKGIEYPCPVCKYTGPIKTDLNSPTALKGLAIEVLVQIVETAPRNVSLVAAIRELIDRVEGKAPQNVNMTVKADPASSLSDDQLAALLALLPDPLIIPPLPKRLDVD